MDILAIFGLQMLKKWTNNKNSYWHIIFLLNPFK